MVTLLHRRRQPLSLAALGLLAWACSAPVEGDEVDGPPEFMGSPSAGAPGVTPQQPASPGNPVDPGGNGPLPSSGAAGSAGAEPVGAAPVGLDPSASAPPSSGAGGSSMIGGNGASGSSFEPAEPANGPAPQQPTPEPPAANPPAPGAGCGEQFVCDGFEGVAPGAAPNAALWRIIDNYSARAESENVQVSAGNARSGAQALRVIGNGRSGIVASLPAQTYFMRAWIQADSVPLGPVLIGLGTDQSSETRLRIFQASSAVINTVGPGDAVRPNAATTGNCPDCVTLAASRWFCAEFFIDNAARNATLWIDGVEAASIQNGDGGWPEQPAAPQMFLGSMSLQGGQTSVWIDDVAAGPQRIGCD